MDYWKRKAELKQRALELTQNNVIKYYKEIGNSIYDSRIFDIKTIFKEFEPRCENTDIQLLKTDSVSAIQEAHKSTDGVNTKMSVLNFASYKNPGGMFLNGSSAQEESLCHESFLYNVISDSKFKDFYDWNNQHLNKALYRNRAIYSPNVLFCEAYKCDVLTCAAPNYTPGKKYGTVSEKENYSVLYNRIEFVLNCFAEMHVDTLILGAYGCGVFGQDSTTVATIFKTLIDTKFKNVFKTIIFAIPDDKNYNNFKTVLKN